MRQVHHKGQLEKRIQVSLFSLFRLVAIQWTAMFLSVSSSTLDLARFRRDDASALSADVLARENEYPIICSIDIRPELHPEECKERFEPSP